MSDNKTRQRLEKAFQSCSLNVIGQDTSPFTAFYHDSSGRSRLGVKLLFSCASPDDWDVLRKSGAFPDKEGKRQENDEISLLIECEERSRNAEGERKNRIAVEAVTITSSSIEEKDLAVRLDVEVIVRCCDNHSMNPSKQQSSIGSVSGTRKTETIAEEEYEGGEDSVGDGSTRVQLEIRAVLECKSSSGKALSLPETPSGDAPQTDDWDIMLGLQALELGGSVKPLPRATTNHYGTKYLRSTPYVLGLHLVKALQIDVIEVGGARAASGATLVSLTIAHSNQHAYPVTITNIALHPGHSRLYSNQLSQQNQGPEFSSNLTAFLSQQHHQHPLPSSTESRSMQGGEFAVIDMSHSCTWSYIPNTAPSLPLTLHPNEAIATVLQIDASEEFRSPRTFTSPISITAFTSSTDVIMTTYCKWTTARIAHEAVDAFSIDMSLTQSKFYVGAPFVVTLTVLNRSQEDRDLMLLMAKDEEGKGGPSDASSAHGMHAQSSMTNINAPASETELEGGYDPGKRASFSTQQTQQQQQQYSVNTAVVSEVNGYTFGVWGLAGEDDGTARHNRDHELLAVDAALLLGEVKGQHSIRAELRFVPLREGTLDVPNLKLYDKLGGRWYNCVHMLKIVASAN